MNNISPFPLINPQKKLILFTNAKCGGTILKQWFLETMDFRKKFSNPIKAINNFGYDFMKTWYKRYFNFYNGKKILTSDKYLRRFIKLYRISTYNLLPQIINDSSWYKIVVIRNPRDRIVSAYVDKFCGTDVSKKWVQQVVETSNCVNSDGIPTITFEQFIEYLNKTDNDIVNPHWRRQSYILNNVTLDMVIDINEISEKLPEVEKQINVQTNMNFNSKRQSNIYQNTEYQSKTYVGDVPNTQIINEFKKTGSYPQKSLFLNDETLAKIHEIYKHDFKLSPYITNQK